MSDEDWMSEALGIAKAKPRTSTIGVTAAGDSERITALRQSLVDAGFGDLVVKSAKRSPLGNAAVGGAKGSQHLNGNALDLDLRGLPEEQRAELMNAAVSAGVKGVGIYGKGDSLHLDMRDTPATWGQGKDQYAGHSPDKHPTWAQGALAQMFGKAQAPQGVAVADGANDDDWMAQSLGLASAKGAGAKPPLPTYEQAAKARETPPQSVGAFGGKTPEEARALIAKLPEGERGAAMAEWAKTYVGEEFANAGPVKRAALGADDFVRSLARGTAVGSFLDEATAATNALTAPLTGRSYDETLAYQRARDARYDAANPVASVANQLTGGITSALVSPNALNTVSATLGQAALSGFGAGEGSAENRLSSAIMSANMGGALMVGANAVGRAVSGVRGLFNAGAPAAGGSLAGYSKDAVKSVAQSVKIDNVNSDAVGRAAADFGPDARLSDYGRTLQNLGEQVAVRDPSVANPITQAAAQRSETASSKLSGAIDNAFGSETNVPKLVADLNAKYAPLREKAYSTFHATPVPYDEALDKTLSTVGLDSSILSSARRAHDMNPKNRGQEFFALPVPKGETAVPKQGERLITAEDGTQTLVKRVPNAMEWDYIKRSLDNAAKSPDGSKRWLYQTMSRDLVNQIDEVLSPGDPQGSVWAQARKLSGDEKGIQDALEAGQSAFRKNANPDQIAQDIAGLAPAEREAYQIGVRQGLRGQIKSSGTPEDRAAQRAFASQYAKEKVNLLGATPQSSNELVNKLAQIANTSSSDANILAASNVGSKRAAAGFIPDDTVPSWGMSSPALAVATGVAALPLTVTDKIINAYRTSSTQKGNTQTVRDMATMLTKTGSTAEEIIGDIIAYNSKLGTQKLNNQQLGALTRDLTGALGKAVTYQNTQNDPTRYAAGGNALQGAVRKLGE